MPICDKIRHFLVTASPATPFPRATFVVRFISIFIICGTATLFIIGFFVGFCVPEFQLISLSASNISFNPVPDDVPQTPAGNEFPTNSLDEFPMNCDWNISFQVFNPHKRRSLFYRKIYWDILYRERWLLYSLYLYEAFFGEDSPNPVDFYFEYLYNQSEFVNYKVSPNADPGWKRFDKKTLDAFIADMKGGSLSFQLLLAADVRLRYHGWSVGRKLIEVWCDGVALSSSSGGSWNLTLAGGAEASNCTSRISDL